MSNKRSFSQLDKNLNDNQGIKTPKLYNSHLDESSEYESDSENDEKNEDGTKSDPDDTNDIYANQSSLMQDDSSYGITIEKFSMDKEDEKDNSDDDEVRLEEVEEDKLLNEINNESSVKKAQLLISKQKEYMRGRSRNKRENLLSISLEEALTHLSFFLSNSNDTVIDTLGKFNSIKKRLQKERPNEAVYVSNAIHHVTKLISLIQSKGFEEDIYDLQVPKLLECIEEETLDKADLLSYKTTKYWSFKRLDKQDDVGHEGHTTYEMDYWNENYFKDNVVVQFSSKSNTEQNWFHIRCLNFKRK